MSEDLNHTVLELRSGDVICLMNKRDDVLPGDTPLNEVKLMSILVICISNMNSARADNICHLLDDYYMEDENDIYFWKSGELVYYNPPAEDMNFEESDIEYSDSDDEFEGNDIGFIRAEIAIREVKLLISQSLENLEIPDVIDDVRDLIYHAHQEPLRKQFTKSMLLFTNHFQNMNINHRKHYTEQLLFIFTEFPGKLKQLLLFDKSEKFKNFLLIAVSKINALFDTTEDLKQKQETQPEYAHALILLNRLIES